jgi:hypothetical protein
MVFLAFSGCQKEDAQSLPAADSNGIPTSLEGNSKTPLKLQTGGASDLLKNKCACELQIVDAYSPVPSGGSGGVLGYEFICDYTGTFQTTYVFGAWATDCMDNDAGVDPSWMIQVPSGNTPTYPTAYFPFRYDIAANASFEVDLGNVFWYNSGGCTVNTNDGGDGYLRVRLRCCDNGREPGCQQCYYSSVLETSLNTSIHYGPGVMAKLGGTCGCDPD